MAKTQSVWGRPDDNVLQEKDDLGATQATYTNEPDEFASLVSYNYNDTPCYYHFDAIGSTRELTDSSESVTNANMFDA